jgi:hypothetical protein
MVASPSEFAGRQGEQKSKGEEKANRDNRKIKNHRNPQ